MTTGALRLPAGDMLSRSALKSEVAKQVRREELGKKEERERREQTVALDFLFLQGLTSRSTLL